MLEFNSYSSLPICSRFSTFIPRWTMPWSPSGGTRQKTEPRFRRPRVRLAIGFGPPRDFLPGPGLKRLGNRVRRNVVPLQRVPADPEQFTEHANAIAQGMDAGSLAMRPRHRDLADDEAELLGQVEQFRIKSPALDPLQRKNCLGAASRESLKAALRILEPQ